MKKICCMLISGLVLLSAAGCRQKDAGTEIKSDVCAFIREVKDNVMVLDLAEYITPEDTERMTELGLTETDLLDGYYIHNAEIESEDYTLTGETTYTFIDWYNDFVEVGADRTVSTTSRDDFIKYLSTYENSQPGMPFFFELKGNEVISITEKPMM